ncbi:hypothetical protein Aau02nite_48390 [Amorphoplanes auranticolor]|uniref:STAS domain-containing protein n=1 Tax=Actinoplanes auranticolor TaxID=47988 RepID=A0A919VQ89_9ACTN|nr:hypothetical protein Aau02nite_48390 [Actinoplanes auranticolor]
MLHASPVSAPPGMDAGSADPDQRDRESIEIIRLMRDPDCPAAERGRLREQVVRWNLPLARGLASRYQHRGETLDDLIQVAALALVKAADGYDPERGHSFTGYAAPTILGELKRHFRDRVWAVHVPRRLQERCLEATRTRTELAQRLHRAPSAAEIATAMGVTEAEVRATEASASAYRADSLNRPVGGHDDAAERQDLLGYEDGSLEAMCNRLTVRAVVDRLPGRERQIIEGYFFGDRTQAQIAGELRTSQMSVSRLLSRTVAKLRDRLTDQAASAPRQPLPNSAGVRVRTHRVRPGYLVAAVRGRLDAEGVADMRDALVDLAVTHRPPMLIVDLRHVRDAAATVAGALLDAYRAGGHTGTRLCVVNVPAQLHVLLCRAGLHRLFACRPVRPAAPLAADGPDGPVPTADPAAQTPQAAPTEVVRSIRCGERATVRTVPAAASRGLAGLRHRSLESPCRLAATAGRRGTAGPAALLADRGPAGTAPSHRHHRTGRNSGPSGLTGPPAGSDRACPLPAKPHHATLSSPRSWPCPLLCRDAPARRSPRPPRRAPRTRPPPHCPRWSPGWSRRWSPSWSARDSDPVSSSATAVWC